MSHNHSESCTGGHDHGHHDHHHDHQHSGEDAEQEERRHYMEVRASFVHYAEWEMPSYQRALDHINKLPKDYAKHLPPATMERIEGMKRGILLNQKFLDRVILKLDEHSYFPIPDAMRDLNAWRQHGVRRKNIEKPLLLDHNASKVRGTLHQIVRDWSQEGEQERKLCYGPILQELQEYLPMEGRRLSSVRVLVPGGGLGRLALEIAALGYACEGNEFSYQMLFVSSLVLNSLGQSEVSICPFVDGTCNNVAAADMCREIRIPDISPTDLLSKVANKMPLGENPDFSMTAGEWLDIYSAPYHKGAWDCVAMCFFIDTAPVLMDYIAAVKHLLRPGGLWINFGPLLYHWASSKEAGGDPRYDASVELSWEEVRHVIVSYGFKIHKEELKECVYTCNQRSMMKTVYKSVLFVATAPEE